jgi:glycosyltransferase involved in cell wall biosynthesis
MTSFIALIKSKKVLFITTKNIDYIRNTQEIRLIKENASEVGLIYSDVKNYAFRILDVWRQITRKKVCQYDVIFLGFEPQFVIPFVGSKFKGKPVIMDFFISVYDTLVCDRRKFKDGSILAKYCHHIDDKTIKMANHVITDTMAHADYFIKEFKADPSIFETLYLEADESIYYPRPQNKTSDFRDKFIVLYFGSILPLQGVDVVLDAIRHLKNNKEIFFQVIGPISDKYNKPIQDNVQYIDWLSQEKLAEYIANADLCLAGHFNKTIAKANRTIPGKAYIYEMMGKKIILGDSDANHELFKEDDRHAFVEMGDGGKLANAICNFTDKI